MNDEQSARDPVDEERGLDKAGERLKKINECLLSFGIDPVENINRLVSLCGELMGATCALYNRLDQGMLCSWGQWNVPPDYTPVDNPEGHICYDVIASGSDEVMFIPHLSESRYAETDANVKRYHLKTYIGKAVKVGSENCGSLCVVYQDDFIPSDDDKTLMSAIASAIGVEEKRRQAEEALRKSEERFRLLMERSPVAMALSDSNDTILYLNDKFIETFGYTLKDIPTVHDWWPLAYPDETFREKVMTGWRAAADKGLRNGSEIEPRETTVMCKDGSSREIDFRVSPIGDIFLVVFYDVTDRKRMEEEIVKIQKLESLGVLAGGIAHDFNNILTAILGNISLAERYVKPGNVVFERLRDAEKASMRAQDLTQQLLTFSKGGAPIKKVSSIGDIIRDSANLVLRGSNVRCIFTVPNDIWPVEVDEGQMSQVFHNLVINADQAMPEGGTVTIRAENVDISTDDRVPLQKGKYVRVTIEDRGIGIPKDYLRKIFDPYFTTKQKGSGLGLAVTYSIIKRHGGYITATSEAGVGTTFTLYLPASQKQMPVPKSQEEAPVAGAGKVLFMDDEEMVRDVAGEMLRQIGYEVAFARDGGEAIELYRRARESAQPFDVLIMDLTVPGGMGGREALKKLIGIDPSVKAIVSSGYSNDPIMATYKDYGFIGVVTKPYKVKQLSEEVNKAMKNRP